MNSPLLVVFDLKKKGKSLMLFFGPSKLSWVNFKLKKLLRSRSQKLCELGRSFDEIKRLGYGSKQ